MFAGNGTDLQTSGKSTFHPDNVVILPVIFGGHPGENGFLSLLQNGEVKGQRSIQLVAERSGENVGNGADHRTFFQNFNRQ